MNIIFFGSDDFAGVHLRALLASGHQVCACVAPPDRPKGRGMKLAVSPVKTVAVEQGIPVLQPVTLKDPGLEDQLRSVDADVFVVVAYGRFLTKAILEIPCRGAVNVHGSLLPRYRGAAPINWALINGETVTGVTVFRLTPAMDAGDIIEQQEIVVDSQDTAATLRERMMEVGPDVLIRALAALETGDENFITQDSRQVTFAPKLTRDMGQVDWTRSAEEIERWVRGLYPWPAAFTFQEGRRLKILEANVETRNDNVGVAPGTILEIDSGGVVVACGQGALRLVTVQPESGKRMDAASYARGHDITVSGFGSAASDD